MVGCQLAARNRFGLVIIRPVLEVGGEPGAACLTASPYGIVVQGGRPQVGVVKVVRLAVGGELALRPRGPGRRMKERILIEDKPTGQESARKENWATKEERKFTKRVGLAREYGAFPYCQSSVSLQLAM